MFLGNGIRCYHLEPPGFWKLQEGLSLPGITVKPAVVFSEVELKKQIEVSFSDFLVFDVYKQYFQDSENPLLFTKYTYTHECTNCDYRGYIEWLHSHNFSISNRLVHSFSPLIIQFFTYEEHSFKRYYEEWNSK